MSRSTISTFQLFALFPDEETARQYLEDRLWPIGWKVKLILHYCGLWQHQRHTCGNCNNAVTTDGDWCKSCLAQSREWNSQFPNGPLKGGR